MSNETVQTNDIVLQTKGSRIGSLMGVQIMGVGSSVPEKVVRNEDLAALGYDDEWIVQRTGILERRHCEEGTATSDLALEAAQRCLADATVDPAEVDLLLVGTYTPDMPLPTTACLVQDRLGVSAPAMDLHAACTSFVFALLTGMQYVATGCCQRVLVIGADCNSRVADPADEHTYPLFGDAAGAVLLGPGSDRQGLLAYAVGSDGSGAELLWQPVGGSLRPFSKANKDDRRHFLQMHGKPIFKWAIRLVQETIRDVLHKAHATLDDVDLFIFHQANMRILNAVIDDAGINPQKVFNNLDRYGNTSAGSIPLALDEALRQGLVKPGNRVLLCGFGAGLTWGTVLLQW
jgi:3-oxoacyl-[acyl-carrier-protein] synthase-3